MPSRRPQKDNAWSVVDFIPLDHDDHGTMIRDEVRMLGRYGISPRNIDHKPCGYQTLDAFCKSALAYFTAQHQCAMTYMFKSQKLGDVQPDSNNVLDLRPGSRSEYHTAGSSLSSDSLPEKQPISRSEDHGTKTSADSMPLECIAYRVLARPEDTEFDISDQKTAIDALIDMNKGYIPGIEIKSIRWRQYRTRSPDLDIEFVRPQHANAAIREGLLVGDMPVTCMKDDRNYASRLCDRCGGYGHYGAVCPNEPRCVICAGPHVKICCPAKEQHDEWRCISCHGPHQTFDDTCPVYQAYIIQVRQAVDQDQKYFCEPGKPADEVAEEESVTSTFPMRLANFISEYGLRGGSRALLRYALAYDDKWYEEEEQKTFVSTGENAIQKQINVKLPPHSSCTNSEFSHSDDGEVNVNGIPARPPSLSDEGDVLQGPAKDVTGFERWLRKRMPPHSSCTNSQMSRSDDGEIKANGISTSPPSLSDEEDVLQGPAKDMNGFERWLRKRM